MKDRKLVNTFYLTDYEHKMLMRMACKLDILEYMCIVEALTRTQMDRDEINRFLRDQEHLRQYLEEEE